MFVKSKKLTPKTGSFCDGFACAAVAVPFQLGECDALESDSAREQIQVVPLAFGLSDWLNRG